MQLMAVLDPFLVVRKQVEGLPGIDIRTGSNTNLSAEKDITTENSLFIGEARS